MTDDAPTHRDPIDHDEETLDPEDWEAMRALAHRMVDDSFEYLKNVRERPVWQPVPDDVVQTFEQPLPQDPGGFEKAYDDFLQNVFPYPMGNIHPRFWSWFMGSGTVTGALGDFLAAVMNPNMAGGNHVANHVEHQVVRWCNEIVGFPRDASGLLVSGASMANLVALAVARHVNAGTDVRGDGICSVDGHLTVYSSAEVHSCHQKAVELMGMGAGTLRKTPVNDDFSIDVVELEKAVAQDRSAGEKPICVVANAGTINTGAVDDLEALAALCEREQLWLHVDGAIGAVVTLAEQHRHLVKGLERADSVALDLHKWMHVPFEAGCVLVKDAAQHRATFSLTPAYLEHATRGLASGVDWFSEFGPQLSRGFRALKVWLMLKEHGAKKFGRLIDQNIRQASHLASLIEQAEHLELMAPVNLNIVVSVSSPGGAQQRMRKSAP